MHQHKKRVRKYLVSGNLVAEYLGLSSDQELKQARSEKTGRFASLSYYRVGTRILYDLNEVDDWLDQRHVENAA